MTETTTGSEQFNIERVFQSAVSIVRNLPKDGPVKPSNDTKLKFYAYFKQATEGPNRTTKPNFITGPTNWYKWDAWHKLGDLSKEEAMSGYIEALRDSFESVPDDAKPENSEILHDDEAKLFYSYCKAKKAT